MRIKKFNEIQAWTNPRTEGEGGESEERLARVQEYLKDECNVDARAFLDAEDVLVVELKKKNWCFASDQMDKFFAGAIMREKGGIGKGEFAGDYIQLHEIGDQISVINSIIRGIEEEADGTLHRCYFAGDHIVIDITI